MKEKYESPTLEIFSFGVRDAIMENGCNPYTCGGDGCSLDCVMDGTCIIDSSGF